MHRSVLWPVLFLILGGLFLVRESSNVRMAELDARFHDWLLRQGSTPARRPVLTLVEISDSSMARQNAWPWRPLDYALFLKAVLPARPGVVAIEPVLRWEDEPNYGNILGNYLLRTPKLLLAAELDVVRAPDSEPVPLPILTKLRGNLAGLPEYAAIKEVPLPDFAEKGFLGAVHFTPDADGLLRRVPMVMRYRGDAIPSFVLQAMMLWLQLVPDDIELRIGESILLGDIMEVPIDAEGNMLLNLQSLGSVERVVFEDLLLAVEEKEAGVEPGFDISGLARKIVLLGRTDEISRTIPLANFRNGSRVEVLAAAIATMQQRGFLYRLPTGGQLGIVLGMGLLLVGAWHTPRFLVFWLTPVVAVVYAMVAMGIFNSKHLLMPAALPYTLLIIVFLLRMVLGGRLPGVDRPESGKPD